MVICGNKIASSKLETRLSFSFVCPVIDYEFHHNIVKVAMDPRGDSQLDLQTTLKMLQKNIFSITGQTH